MATRYFALILGIIYVLVGVAGFIPNLLQAPPTTAPGVTVNSDYGLLLGLFPVNILHTIVHLLIGIWGIIAYISYSGSRTFARVVAVLFIVLTIMGLIPVLNTTFGLIPLYGHDIWLHALTGIVAAYFGFVRQPVDEATERPRERAM